LNIIKKVVKSLLSFAPPPVKAELPAPKGCNGCAAAAATSTTLAQSLVDASAEIFMLKRVFRNLTGSQPILVILPPEATVIANDFQVVDGRFVKVDKSLIGKPAGMFSIFVRKII
jgi:hypothetical protein